MSGATRPPNTRSRSAKSLMAAASTAVALPSLPTADAPAAPPSQPHVELAMDVDVEEMPRPRKSWCPTNSARSAARTAKRLVASRHPTLAEYDFALLNRYFPLAKKSGDPSSAWLPLREAFARDDLLFNRALCYIGLCFPREVFRDSHWLDARGDRNAFPRIEVDPSGPGKFTSMRANSIDIPVTDRSELERQRKLLPSMLQHINALNYDHEKGCTSAGDAFERNGENVSIVSLRGRSDVWSFGFYRQHDLAPWYAECRPASECPVLQDASSDDFCLEDEQQYAEQQQQQHEEPPGPPPSVAPPSIGQSVVATPVEEAKKTKKKRTSSSGSKKRKDTAAPVAPTVLHDTNSMSDTSVASASSKSASASSLPAAAPPAKRAKGAPAITHFSLVTEPDGRYTRPLSVAVCEEGGHLYATQDLTRHWPYVAAYLRSKGVTEAAITEHRRLSEANYKTVARVEFVTTEDESGAEVPVTPLCAFVRYGSSPAVEPTLVQMPELAAFKPHLTAIMKLFGASQELTEQVLREVNEEA